MKTIYLDNAATTPVDPTVFQAMKPFFSQKFGNASEAHKWGTAAREAIEKSRSTLAQFLGAKPKEIIFTSGATESINLSHKGLIEGFKKPHIITSHIEHKAVLETLKHLENLGLAEVTYLPVDKFGLVKVSDVEKAIKPNTVLVSIIYVNNEVGTIEPISQIGKLLKKLNTQRTVNHKPITYFHTDATQAIQYLNCNVDDLGVDLLSLTGHKFYAPKGIGALFVRSGTPLIRQQDGGSQERNLRAGTENVPFIVGMGKAIEMVAKNKASHFQQTSKLRDELINHLTKIPGVVLTGHPTTRAPHIASFLIDGVEGEALELLLSDKGIAVSTGSACTSSDLAPSHVLSAMGFPPERSHGSLRISLGKDTTEDDINYITSVLPGIINKLRLMAPSF